MSVDPVIGGTTVSITFAVKPASVALSRAKPVSLAELSVQLRFSPAVAEATVRLDGASGGTVKVIALIMSFSSWPRMWQCQTYSQPKFCTAFGVCAPMLVNGFTSVKIEHGAGVAVPGAVIAGQSLPTGIVTSISR
jgi:hypothetical protein